MKKTETHFSEKNGKMIKSFEINGKKTIQIFPIVGYEEYCKLRRELEQKNYKPYEVYIDSDKKMRVKYKYSLVVIPTRWYLEVRK